MMETCEGHKDVPLPFSGLILLHVHFILLKYLLSEGT